LEDDNPPLARQFDPPVQEHTVMGENFAEIMQELNANKRRGSFPQCTLQKQHFI